MNIQKTLPSLCNISFARYSEKRFTQIYIALCGVAMHVCVAKSPKIGNIHVRAFLASSLMPRHAKAWKFKHPCVAK